MSKIIFNGSYRTGRVAYMDCETYEIHTHMGSDVSSVTIYEGDCTVHVRPDPYNTKATITSNRRQYVDIEINHYNYDRSRSKDEIVADIRKNFDSISDLLSELIDE